MPHKIYPFLLTLTGHGYVDLKKRVRISVALTLIK